MQRALMFIFALVVAVVVATYEATEHKLREEARIAKITAAIDEAEAEHARVYKDCVLTTKLAWSACWAQANAAANSLYRLKVAQ